MLGALLDFTLERSTDGARFVTELKCEIEFERCRYLSLTDPQQVDHHTGNAAFQKLLRSASQPGSQRVTIQAARFKWMVLYLSGVS